MRTLLLASLFSLLASAAHAQARPLVYAEGGLAGVAGFFGRWSDSFHVGAGGEVVVDDRLGFGGEVGFYNRFLASSANATLHLVHASSHRFVPFVTGGYSYFGVGDGAFSALNVGAGVNYWAADRLGFRAEFRDHFRPDDRGTTQYWSARVGVVFR